VAIQEPVERVSESAPRPISSVILKIAGNCNLDCTYCYWFRLPDARRTYGNMSPEVVDAFLERFERHLQEHKLTRFHFSLHGGEPLLFPKHRFADLCQRLRMIGQRHACDIEISVNSNGTLVDDEWCAIFRGLVDHVGISIDGPRQIHDARRIDLLGRGTYDKVLEGIACLKRNGIKYGVLSVASPDTNAIELVKLLVDELGVNNFDVLIPDATHDAPPNRSIAAFYIALYDLYSEQLVERGVKIRILQEWVRSCLGFQSRTQSIGRGLVRTVMVKQDGKIEPVDTLHNLAEFYVPGPLSVFNSELNAITQDPLWLRVYSESERIPTDCLSCRHKNTCGGGNIVERWSTVRGFDNRNVYCSDLQQIYDHVCASLEQHLDEH
jgi:uncharacterized protein